MLHFSKLVVAAFMRSRSFPLSLLIASIGATFATATSAAAGELPDPELKLSREIESPVKRAAPASPAPATPAVAPGLPAIHVAAAGRLPGDDDAP